MKIAVIGIGYVGMSNAVVLAKQNTVFAYDINQNKINLLNKKTSPIKDNLLNDYLKNKELDLTGTHNFEEAVANAGYVVICTPTNFNPNTNVFDTSSVESVIKQVKDINPSAWIVIKSTVGIGFTKNAVRQYQFKNILFSPEFLREGNPLFDDLHPSRIIVGVPEKTGKYFEKANIFASLLANAAEDKNVKIQIIGSSEAESVKLFSNTYLAMRVAYINELDTFARIKELNTKEIIDGICADPRIGDFYNNPSFGYGGYCLPKDAKELKSNFNDIPQNLITATVDSNHSRKKFIADELIKIIKPNDIVGIYRLTMKANVDDFRQSSILDIIKEFKKRNINMVIFEPNLNKKTFDGIDVIDEIKTFKRKTDIIVANRYNSSLDDVKSKVFTCDLYNRD